MIAALALLVLCQLAGEVLARLAGIPVPGPVLGMVLLFLGLAWRGRMPEPLRRTSRGILAHLSLLFVPAGTGMMLHVARLKAEWLPILASLILSTALTIVVTGWVFSAMSRLTGDMAEDER
jgi:holin-like protein